MARLKVKKVVKGYVVKRETMAEKDDPKHPGKKIKFKSRVEISRMYHAISAAETFLALCKKQWPDGDFYIHEKTGADGLTFTKPYGTDD